MSTLKVKNGVVIGGTDTEGKNAKFKVGASYVDKSIGAPRNPGAENTPSITPSSGGRPMDAAANAAPGVPDATSAAPETPSVPQNGPVDPNSTGQVSYDQAKANLNSGGLSGGALAAAQTSLSSRYQQGLQAANASGVPAPADAGAARSGVQSYLPPSPQDSGVVDDIFSNDPVIGQLMSGITQLLNPKNQTTSLMQDYKSLYKQSGLKDINEELIDAETVLDGTEDDIRNEIQTAGGMGTESQVQAMTLARNKGLLKRYNQLVQMKTDATNNLNTMMQLNSQDKQMAQERVNQTISTMFNMANFRQTALQNTRQQQQWMVQTMGADGYYAAVSKDPRQLAMAEQILGAAPGGLQAMAAQAAKERALDIQTKQAQINASNASAAASSANAAKTRYELDQLQNPTDSSGQSPADQVTFLKNTVASARALSGGAGQSGVTRFLGNLLVGDTQRNRLQSQVETLKSNMLTLAADPNIKKFFGPQMSDNDVKAMQAAGTTLNVDNMSRADLESELDRLDSIFNKLNGATNYDPSGGAWIVQ